MARAKLKTGRPTDYTEDLAEAICDAIGSTARGLDYLCALNDAFPSARTVHRWLAANEAFRQIYLQARTRQADLIFDECLTIIDTPLIGIEKTTKPDGTVETREGDMLGHRKLQVDTRMRMAGKLSPKKYGDKVALVGGDPEAGDNPIQITDRDRAKAMAALLAKSRNNT